MPHENNQQADDFPNIRARIVEINKEKMPELAKLTHKDNCTFLAFPGAGCSCGACDKL